MKALLLVTMLPPLALSATQVAEQQPFNPQLSQEMTAQALFGDQLPSSDPAADVRSVMLRYIANVTASLAEEYLRDLIASGLEIIRTNEPMSTAKLQAGTTAAPQVKDQTVKPEDPGSAYQDGNMSRFDTSASHEGTTTTVRLLPPSWPALSIKPLVPASCPCNCNNPTSPCCIKLCVNHSKLRVDPPLSAFNESQAALPELVTEPSTEQIAVGQAPASCPCNCDNPTTVCCMKICVNRLKIQVDQQLSTSTSAAPEYQQAQGVLPNPAMESDTDQAAQAQIATSCPCNCNNPRTTCCIKICVNHLKARLDQQLATSGTTAVEESQAHEPSFEKLSDASLDNAGGHIDHGYRGGDVGLVALATSTGTLLTVEAESDLNLYASFVSNDVIQKLGLTAEIHALTETGTSAVVISGQSYEVVGTVPITVEAYTRKNFTFEDLFYVIATSGESVGGEMPGLVFGIDHVRQVEGLALKPDIFI
ncbi:hypothetical protein PV04_07996 [Phialophora macrospora]|uniref:Hydrophobin n=1 Tax=Phialophora macrospora TaxID=1851006 RepID=A0A0D2G0W5_9EURO|nr:hypothetical protein PV04_07996 [Phialophora macrospora]